MSIKSHWGRILLTGASLAAMATPAFAQQNGQSTTSEEIVVTATGRQAAIQDVPVAVTAVGAEQLRNAGVSRLTDLEGLAPSFHSNVGQSTTAGTIARIRGLGTGADNPGFESAVGIFIDGVYRARTGVAMSELPELERVEVLRGPQGTLFGRNTSAGAINIVTAGPNFENSWWADGSGGDLGFWAAHAGANVPVVEDKVALRFDGSIRRRDGYITDVLTGNTIDDQNRWSLRGQALFDLTPQSSLRIIADWARTDENCCGAVPLIYGSPQSIITAIVGANATPPGRVGNLNTHVEDRQMTVSPGRDYNERVNEKGISAQYDNDFGNVDLTYITSFRNWESTRNQDVDFSKLDLAYRDGLEINFRNMSHELRLHGQLGRLDWLAGVYYGHEELDTTDRIRLGVDANAYINTTVQAATNPALQNPVTTPGGPYELFDSQPGACLDTNPATCDVVRSLFYFASSFNPLLANAYLATSPAGSGQQRDHWHVDTDSMSFFTHNELALTDQLTFTLGVRYTRDVKNMHADLNSSVPTCTSLQGLEVATDPAIPGPGGIVAAMQVTALGQLLTLSCNPAINPIANGGYTNKHHETEWSGTSSLAWRPTDDLMMYVGYSRGYKAGGYNLDRSGFQGLSPATVNPALLNASSLRFNPEFTDSYEVGFKSTIFGGSTDFNVTAFMEKIDGYQSNNFNGFNFITRNVPEAVSSGVEMDLLARITPHLQLTGGITYDDAHYESTVNFLAPNPDASGLNTIHDGQPFDHAPLWSGNAAITWDHQIAENMMLFAYLDARYSGDYVNQTLNRDPRTDQDAFMLFNGRLGFGPADQHWGVEFWGRNLADEFYKVGAFGATLQTGTFLIYPNEPRTLGVTLRVRH